MRPALLLVCSLMLLAGCAKREPPSHHPREAAERGRAVFQSLINKQTYQGFGFDSLDEAGQVELGSPMAVFNVPPERLWGFHSGKDTSALLVRSFETIYPVTVGGRVKSSLTVVRTGKKAYRAAGFGDAALVKRLSDYRSGDKTGEFVVRVLGLHMYFLGRMAEGRFTLTPIEDDPRFGLRVGERYDADDVLQRLARIADVSYPPR